MTVVAAAESSSSCFASSSASCNSGSVDSMNTKVDIKMTPSETNAATFKHLKYRMSCKYALEVREHYFFHICTLAGTAPHESAVCTKKETWEDYC